MVIKNCKGAVDSRRAAEEAIARSKDPKSKWKDNG
jgi:hypothetical protein